MSDAEVEAAVRAIARAGRLRELARRLIEELSADEVLLLGHECCSPPSSNPGWQFVQGWTAGVVELIGAASGLPVSDRVLRATLYSSTDRALKSGASRLAKLRERLDGSDP